MEYSPYIEATIGFAPQVDGVVIRPPVLYHAVAVDLNQDPTASIDGRYLDGEARGDYIVKCQDTYLTGTSSRTGMAFTADDGTWYDNWKAPETGKFGLLHPDSSDDVTFGVSQTTPDTTFLSYKIVVGRGNPAISDNKTPTETYCYLYLCSSSTNGQYRLRMAWGVPICLQYCAPSADPDTEASWSTVAIARALGDCQTYLQNNHSQIVATVLPDPNAGVLRVEIGSGHLLRHSPGRTVSSGTGGQEVVTPVWPNAGGLKLAGKNGLCSFEVYPLRFQPVTLTKTGQSIPAGVSVADAQVSVNGLSFQDSTQTNIPTVTQDGDGSLDLSIEGSCEQNEDELGSDLPPLFSDVLVYIPPQFSYSPGGIVKVLANPLLRTIQVRETQTWDDNTHYAYTRGHVILNNTGGYYRGMTGNYALAISAGNGSVWGNRVRGLLGVGSEGISIQRSDPTNIVTAPFYDNTIKLQQELGYELVADGLCLFTVLRILLMAGGFAPERLKRIPDVGLPPYPDAMPYPVLGKGTGMSPRYRFDATSVILTDIVDLLRDSGQVVYDSDGIPLYSIPYYFWQDQYGDVHVEAYNTSGMTPVKRYYTSMSMSWTGEDSGLIHSSLEVLTSVDQMRTEVNMQGLDPWTNELMTVNLPLTDNLNIVGYRRPAFARSSRFCSRLALERAANVAAWQASQSDEYVRFTALFDPSVFAGNLIIVSDDMALGRTGVFRVIEIDSVYGMADITQQDGRSILQSVILARNAESAAL